MLQVCLWISIQVSCHTFALHNMHINSDAPIIIDDTVYYDRVAVYNKNMHQSLFVKHTFACQYAPIFALF